MTLLRTAVLITLSLLILTSCGGKKEAKATAKPAATEAKTEKDSTEDLFNEFFDSTSTEDEAAEDEANAASKDAKNADASVKSKSTVNAKSKESTNVETKEPSKALASNKKTTTSAPKSKANPDGRYVLQVSCVASSELAEKIAKKLEKTGYPVYIAEVQNPTPQLIGNYFRIRIGGFSDRNSAKAFGDSQLTPNGFSFWVDTRSNDNIGGASSSKPSKTEPSKTEEPTPAASVAPTKNAAGEEEW